MNRVNFSILSSKKSLTHLSILFYLLIIFLFFPPSSPAEQIDDLLSKGAEGSVEAQLQLGETYYSGKGKDLELSFYWYEKAARQGHPKAQRALGAMYELGKGTAKSPEKAAYWYRKAADQGLARAQTNLGVLLETGVGVQQNYAEAITWYQKAAEQGYARGQTYLGRIYEFGRGVEVDFAKALHWYSKAAEQGYARAQTNLGALYEAGQGVNQDFQEAMGWYTKAANKRYARGQFYLGRMFEQGHGTEKDIKQALYWYKQAAALGHNQALIQFDKLEKQYSQLDDIIDEPVSVQEEEPEEKEKPVVSSDETVDSKPEPAPVQAEDPLTAAEQGDANYQNSLALLYLKGGDGYEKNDEKAAHWFHKAAENGSVDAQNNLGIMYLTGQGVEKDLKEAAVWLQKAAESGNAAAQSNLGLMYYYDEGVEKDFQQAAYWLLKSAKQGDVTAQNNLAVMYSEGLGVNKNQDRAIYWLQKAADQGDAMARKNLAMIVLDQPYSTSSSLFKGESQSSVSSVTSIENGSTTPPPSPEAMPDLNARKEAKEHFNTGNEHAKAGEFDSAITEYKKAIALDPGNSNTFENLAISYAKSGNPVEAVKTMEKAIILSPDDAMKHSTLGIIFHADNQLQRALEQYIRSVRLNPGFGETYYNIAVIYRELDQLTFAYIAGLQAQDLGYAGSSQLLLELQKIDPNLPNFTQNKNISVHLRHIVTPSVDKAEYVLGRLKEAGDFSQLAAEFSLPPFNLNGGYIGPFSPYELMPEIAEKLIPLDPLTFSQVLETSSGFHIFQKFMVYDDLLKSN